MQLLIGQDKLSCQPHEGAKHYKPCSPSSVAACIQEAYVFQYCGTEILQLFKSLPKKTQKQTKIISPVSTGCLFPSSCFYCKASYSNQLPGAVFLPSGAELFFQWAPRLDSKISRANPLLAASLGTHQSDRGKAQAFSTC